MAHPCLSCGACCAFFRVSFYWREADPQASQRPVPADYAVETDHHKRSMKGTERGLKIRCKALEGRIGEQVKCKIYSHRPSPCRDFTASFEFGARNKKCDEARIHHGLEPLKAEDWSNLHSGAAFDSLAPWDDNGYTPNA